MIEDAVAEEERCALTESVHVHLSDTFQIKYSHILSWFLPQLKSRENNVLSPLDPGIGRVTNYVKSVGHNSAVVLTTSLYNVAIVLDMSPSMFTVDMDHKKVIIEELDEALKMCIAPLCTPELHPWTDEPNLTLDVNLTVIAYTPQFKNKFISVLIQGYPLRQSNSAQLISVLEKRCLEMHTHIKAFSSQSTWSCTDLSTVNQSTRSCTDLSTVNRSDRSGLTGLIGEVLTILKVQRSKVFSAANCDNSKNVMIMITDGVIGETHQARQIVNRLHEHSASCSFVRVGPFDPPGHYGFGYVPNISLLRFIADASDGQYWDWGKKHEIKVELVFRWSFFHDPPDIRGLTQKTVESSYLMNASLISTIARKIFEGFKICDIDVRSQGLAPDFSGTEVLKLHVTMALTWRRRIHVTYELVIDIPVETYGVARAAPQVKVTVCIYGDYAVINAKQDEDGKHRTPVKLLEHFTRFLAEQLRPHQDDTYEKRWIYDLHNYSFSSLSKRSSDLTSQRNEPYKIERISSPTTEQEMIRFNKFWLHFLVEKEPKEYIGAHFDVYVVKCWLQFDLNLPKCLNGVTKSNKNHNKEFQIYSRSHGFLLDVLVKWCDIMVEKEMYIKLYETRPSSAESHSNNSFVWVTLHMASTAAMSIYIAMHRDIPFSEQQEIKSDLFSKLMDVKFQGSLLLDSNIKVGLDTTLKKRGGNFIPFNLKAEHACQIIPKNVDDIILSSSGIRKGDMYLHKLVCNWKTCPDVNCCSDELIKELRNEVFNALFRLRLQEQYRPLNVNGKMFSCFSVLKIKSLQHDTVSPSIVNPGHDVTSPDDTLTPSMDTSDASCLLQYIISVDDDVCPERKSDHRKISPYFTTEILIEPQWGNANCAEGCLNYLHGLEFQMIPPRIFDLDFKLISSLCSFATVKKLCLQLDKHQPEFSDHIRAQATSFKEPIVTRDVSYLFLVSNLLNRSLLNVLNFPLINVETSHSEGSQDSGADSLSEVTGTSADTPSPNTRLLHSLSELLEVSNSREIYLSEAELKTIQEDVKLRNPISQKIKFSDEITESHWKCYVRFHKLENKDDKSRLQFTLIPDPPEHFTETQIRKWFPDGTVDVLVFDCFYKILLGTFTSPDRCSLSKLYECDTFSDQTEDLEGLECPSLITQIIRESTPAHSTTSNIEKSMCFTYVGEICKAYERSYILGVHDAILHDTPLLQSCADKALRLIDKPRLLDVHIKKEEKHISLSRYMSAVCSHVSGLHASCETTEVLDRSADSSERGVVNSESYNADVDLNHDLMEDNSSNLYSTADNTTADNSTDSAEEDSDHLSTPCQHETQWTSVSLKGLPLCQGDTYGGEIVSASSAELTPVINERRIEELRLQLYCDRNADIDLDSGDSSLEGQSPEGPQEDGYKEMKWLQTEKQQCDEELRLEDDPLAITPTTDSEMDGKTFEHTGQDSLHFEETVTPDAAENLDQSVHSYNPVKAVTQKIQLVLEPEEITQPGDATESKPLVDEVPVPVHSLPEDESLQTDPLGEKKVSFCDHEVSCSPLYNNSPIVDIITSTPVLAGEARYMIQTEDHNSIRDKFDDIMENRFIRIPQYSDKFVVMLPDSMEYTDSINAEREDPAVLFLRMSCQPGQYEDQRPITTLPTCILDVMETPDSRKKKEIELCFTCYSIPVIVPLTPIYRSPTQSFIGVRPPYRRKESYRKSDGKNGEKKEHAPEKENDSLPERSVSCVHHFRGSNADDTDDGLVDYSITKPRFRVEIPVSPASTPNLLMQSPIIDPITKRSVLDDMYQEIKWLIDDQHITHLRRKIPVTLDVLKQVLDHCKRAPANARHCVHQMEEISYVDAWAVRDEKVTRQSDSDKSQKNDLKEEKSRHEELLAKIVLATEFEDYSLCRIDDFFYYSLAEENETMDAIGREMLSAQSSISSMSSPRPSLRFSSSSSLHDDLPSISSLECSMRPCSNFWVVIQMNQGHFQVAAHTADSGMDCRLNRALLDKIVSQILLINKIQNQEFLLQQIVDNRVCPSELLLNHTPLPRGEGYDNRYVCDVVHTIEVQLWDKDEHEGLRDIKESLFNFKCYNPEESVYSHIQDHAQKQRSTFYFQLPEPNDSKPGIKSKKLHIEVRGLQPPDPDEQSNFDHFVQQKLEEAKLEDIAYRLKRNSQAKLTEEEISFLSNKNHKSHRTLYMKIPPYIYKYLPFFWFYLDQHLVQQHDLFCPRYDSNNNRRIQFSNEVTGELETTRDHEVFIKLNIANRKVDRDVRYTNRGRLQNEGLFQSLLLVNITIVENDNQPVDFHKRWFKKESPVLEPGYADSTPPVKNEDIKFTTKIAENSEKCHKNPMSLKLRIIEKRKKGGSTQKCDREFENSLFQAIQAAYTSLLLEVYILPVELTKSCASAIVGCVDEDPLCVTPKQFSSSVGGRTGSLLSKMKGRRGSQDCLDAIRDTDRNRKKVQTSLSKDDNCTLHPNLREPCINACRVGALLKTQIVEHHSMQIPSLFVSFQVINKIIEGLKSYLRVRMFVQDSDYKMIPPTCHTEDDIESSTILLVAQRLSLWNDARIKLQVSNMPIVDEKPNTEQILSLESGSMEVALKKLDVPRQMHIVVILKRKKLDLYFYNVHFKQISPFINSIRGLISWLTTRKMVLTRVLLLKGRHELPPHYTRTQSELLPQNQEEVEQFIEQTEPDSHVSDQSQQQSMFKNKEIENYYVHLYDHYHAGMVCVGDTKVRSRDPLQRHGRQLGAYMRAAEHKKEEEEKGVDLDDPDLPNSITREQAKLLKQNARLLHFIASPLLFSSKLKSSQTDKETFSYLSNTPNDAWFLHFKNHLFDKFLAYLRDKDRGIGMTLKYSPQGLNKDVDPKNTLNADDNEALLCKETVGGGHILIGVLIQNSTFCVKLYGFDSDNRLRLFQECQNLKTQTHTNSFNYDRMVHAIYTSLLAHRDGRRDDYVIPVHQCVQSIVKHYNSVAEPPHTRSWIKYFTDLTYVSKVKDQAYNIKAESLHEHILQAQESLGVFAIPSESKAKKSEELLVLIPQDPPSNRLVPGREPQDVILNLGDINTCYKIAIIVSSITDGRPGEFGLSYYIILVNQFINSPPSTLNKEVASLVRSRAESVTKVNESLLKANASLTTISMASSPSPETDGMDEHRSRVSSQIFHAYDAKQERYRKAKVAVEKELQELLKCALNSYHRDALVQKLLRPSMSKVSIGLEVSYHSFLRDDFKYQHLLELQGDDLSFNKNLLEDRSIFKLLLNWNSTPRFKKLLEYLKTKVTLLVINDINAEGDRSDIAILSKRTAILGKADKVSIVVLKRTKSYGLDVFAVLKNQAEKNDRDHVQFWERILTLISVYVWERLS